jgi:cell division protein FtsL
MREARTRLHALHSEIKELSTRVKIKEGAKKTIVF